MVNGDFLKRGEKCTAFPAKIREITTNGILATLATELVATGTGLDCTAPFWPFFAQNAHP
jgi:hypothetical protein